jgi:hypothetical protein
VDPARTLFRIASITKLFTWTAVMRLAERGAEPAGETPNKGIERENLYIEEFLGSMDRSKAIETPGCLPLFMSERA